MYLLNEKQYNYLIFIGVEYTDLTNILKVIVKIE